LAVALFQKVSFNTAMAACSRSGHCDDALVILKTMEMLMVAADDTRSLNISLIISLNISLNITKRSYIAALPRM
jgi:pentatricopeptide repeat protein